MEIKNAARAASLPKLLLCDDHRLVLDALTPLLRSEFTVIAVDNSRACLEAAETFRPHVAVLDVEMPGDDDGFTIAQKLHQRQPALLIVLLSMHSGMGYINRALQVGAKAYISKSAPVSELLSGLRAVLNGESLLTASRQASLSSMNGESGSNACDLLTPRQRDVLSLIARGCGAKDIANRLAISVRTAEYHRAALMERLNLHSTAELTRYAIAHNLG